VGRELASLVADSSIRLYIYDSGGSGSGENLIILLGEDDTSIRVYAGILPACAGYCLANESGDTADLGTRTTGWHALDIGVSYDVDGTGGTISMRVDGADGTGTVAFDGELALLWFNDDGAANYIDDISIYDSAACQGTLVTWYADVDGDGYGDATQATVSDVHPSGYTDDSTDCNDTNPAVNPGATEIPGDGIDNDCDGAVDGAPEVCDGYDNDSDGEIDEADVCSSVFVPSPVARYALELAESGSAYVEVPSSSDWEVCAGDEFTVELWAEVDFDTTASAWQDLAWMGALGGDSWALRTNQDAEQGANMVYLHWNSTSSAVDQDYYKVGVTLGGWHFFAFQFDTSGTPEIWIDGVEVGGTHNSWTSGVLTGCTTAGTLYIGGTPPYEKNGTYGWMRISDVLRYDSTYVGIPSELRIDEWTLAAWSMDQSSGATVADESGNGHTGTLNGTTSWASVSY
jgi:hypothetical protein